MNWQRITGAAGVIFVVLNLPAFVLLPPPPDAASATQQIAAYYADHRSAWLVITYVQGISLLFFLWFACGLRRVLRSHEPAGGMLSTFAWSAAVTAQALVLVGGAVQTALAFKAAQQGDAAVVRALFDLQNIIFTFLSFPIAALIGAAGLVMVLTGAVARWLGWAGLVLAIIELIAAAALADSGPFAAGGPLGLIGFLAFAVWLLVTSVMLLVRPGPGRQAFFSEE